MNNSEQLKSFIRRWGPDILSGLATIGVGLTAYFSGKATVKNYYTISTEPVYGEPIKSEVKRARRRAVKNYIPTIVSGVLTIGCIWGSRKLSAKQIASLAAAAGYLVSTRKKSESNDTNISKIDPPVSVEETGNGDVLCLEAFSGRWFRSSVESVEEACRYLNDIYRHDFEEKGYCAVPLNELYHLLGIQTTYFGDKVFWCNENNGEKIIYANYFEDWGENVGKVYVLEPIEESMPSMMKIDY